MQITSHYSVNKQITNLIVIISVGLLFAGCRQTDDAVHTKSRWIKEYMEEIKSGRYPGIHAISWWHEDYDNTFLTINSSRHSLKAYRNSVSDDLFLTECAFSDKKLIPLPGRIYHSAFPDFGGTEDEVTGGRIDEFEALAGKKIAWSYFSNNWLDSLTFPGGAVEVISGKRSVPFIRLMFRSVFEENREDPKYKMRDILNGKYDNAIKAWADEAGSCGVALLVEFGTEVNGRWFPWNGAYSGGGKTDLYGDPDYPDGPEIFRDSYRHIIDLCNQQGCDNITWFFHIDLNDDPEAWWNEPVYYYPGDDYIDWIGISTYGPLERGDDYAEPAEMLRQAYQNMKTISEKKPYAILEFGITEL
jgi:hypothetical protein